MKDTAVTSMEVEIETEETQRAELRRMKVVATSMLLLAAIVFIVFRAIEEDNSWAGYIRATAEAAMVGAFADWFAVTALFKHPLGIPIPHTAIIPKRKDEIGEGLGDFVQSNFLTGEVISEKLEQAAIAKRIADWLADPDHARSIVSEVAVVTGAISEVLRDDEDVRDLVDSLVRDRLAKVPVAPIVGRVIDAGMDGGHHHEVYNVVLSGAASFLEDNRETFRRRLTQESPWWVPEPVDDRVFERIFSAVMTFLREVDHNPHHHFKKDLDDRARVLAVRMRDDERLIEQGEQLKTELLDHPEFQAWTKDLWSSLQAGFSDATQEPDSEVRARIEQAIIAVAERLRTDEDLQAKIDEWIRSVVVYLAEHGRTEIAGLISNTVQNWDANETSERIELQVGRDLQFIRINGTLVGGLVGLLIYTSSELFF
ncbi:MAG: DUF445 domain-containing protein [Acidimicrobiales bacterium]|nr:DUF445 domain-containing protein [Acidimicrobiales bacterium]